jgi:Alternative complex III, ActD subunit
MTPDEVKEKLGMGPDKLYAVMGEFSEPDDLVAAGRKIREMGYTKLDAMTPFPVHGIDAAIGIPESKLGWMVIWCSAAGALTAQLLMWWIGAINYPLVIGGKPLYDFSYSIPVTFELTILCSAFGAFLGMFAFNGLPKLYHPAFKHPSTYRASDDRFLLVIEAGDPKFDPQKTVEHLKSVGADLVEVVEG